MEFLDPDPFFVIFTPKKCVRGHSCLLILTGQGLFALVCRMDLYPIHGANWWFSVGLTTRTSNHCWCSLLGSATMLIIISGQIKNHHLSLGHGVLYIIHQNNPVSKSLRCMIPWYLRNRNYRRRVLRYRRRVPSYRRHPIKLPSSGIPDNFAYRRLAANLSEIIIRKWDFDARCTMPLSFVVANLREIDGCTKAGGCKNFSKQVAASAPSWRR